MTLYNDMGVQKLRALLVEPNQIDAEFLRGVLSQAGSRATELKWVKTLAEAQENLTGDLPDIILFALDEEAELTMEAFDRVNATAPQIPIIILSRKVDDDMSWSSIRRGAQDYIVKGEIDGKMFWRAMHYAIERKHSEHALQESEHRYKLLTENMMDVIWSIDLSFRFTSMSPSVINMRGYTVDEAMQQSVTDVLSPNSLQNCLKALSEQLEIEKKKTGDPQRSWVVELEQSKKGGGTIWTETQMTFVRDDKGNPVGILGVSREISKHKEAESKLNLAEEKYRMIFENSAVAITVTDADEKIISWNKYTEKLLGMSHDDLYMKPVKSLYPEKEWERMQSMNLRQKRMTHHLPAKMYKKDGSLLDIDISVTVLRTADGGKTGSIGIIRDTTESVQADKRLREAEQRYRTIFENSAVAITVTDADERIISWNKYAEKLLGMDHNDLHHKTVRELYDDEEWKRIQSLNLRERGMTDHLETYIYRKDGARLDIDMSITVLKTDDGGKTGSIGIFRDITESKRSEERLKAAEEKYRTIFDNSAVAITMTDEEERITSWNKYAEKLLGMEHQDLHMKPVKELYDPEEWKRIQSLNLRKKGMTHHLETFVFRKDGSRLDIDISVTVLKTESGGKTGSIGIFRDITSRKETQRQLRLAEEKYRTIFENSAVGITMTDEEERIISWNKYAEKLLGLGPEELRMKPVKDLYSKEEWKRLQSMNLRQKGMTDHLETQFVRSDGTMLDIDLSLTVLRTDDGGKTGSIGIFKDITEAKKNEEKVRAAEEKYRTIFDHSPVAITMADNEGRIISWNRFAEELLQMNSDHLFMKSVETLYPKEEWQKILDLNIRSMGTAHFETKIVRGSDQLMDAKISVSILEDDDGNVTGSIGIIRDITERNKMISEINKSKEEAETANRTKSEFLSNMSHEIRTPMNGVMGMVGLLLETELSSEQREYAEFVKDSADALLTVINDILDFSKIEAGKMALEPIPFDVLTSIEEVAGILQPKVQEKGIEFIVRCEPGTPSRVIGDPGRIRQILMNLASNAIKFTHKGYVLVDIKMEKKEGNSGQFLIRVEDTGIGIPEDKIAMLWEKFTQADSSTTRKYGGTGLGLAICQQLVHLMGGEIGADSREGRGSTFWFRIPLPIDKAEPAVLPKADLTGVHVLICDDIELNRRIITEQVSSWGMRSEAYASGEEALAALHKAHDQGDPYQMAILDFQLPGMDGLMLARNIKKDPMIKDTVLVMLTSVGQRGDGKEMEEAGLAGYLVKPARQSHLLDTLSTVWGMRSKGVGGGLVTQYTIKEDNRKKIGEDKKSEKTDTVKEIQGRILVVEDNVVNQKVSKRMIEKIGCHVDVASDGREALAMVKKTSYDVIFMDCQMPEMDGFEATAEIRKQEGKDERIPIVALTANAMQGDREKCLDAGMDDYVSKPVKAEDLEKVLEKWLEKRTQRNSLTQSTSTQAEHSEPEKESTPAVAKDEKPAIDEKRIGALNEFAGDDDDSFLDDLFDTFFTTFDERLTDIKKALETDDAEELNRHAHTIKGSSRNLGALILAEICERLERLGKSGTVQGAEADVAKLEVEIKRVESEFNAKWKGNKAK